MKRLLILKTGIILSLFFTISSCGNDDSLDENPQIVGSWSRVEHWGSIDGTNTITFSSNLTYSVKLTRTEDFNGPCEMDPYCDNDYSGEYWFDGNRLYYNHSTLGWTDYFNEWSVEGNKLILDGDLYNKQ